MKVALLFNFKPSWTGGIIYLQNIARILNYLDSNDKPELLVFYPKELENYVKEIEYSHLQLIEWKFPELKEEFLKSIFLSRNILTRKIKNEFGPDIFFPVRNFPIKSDSHASEICWFADLQHKHYPEFFSKKKILELDLRTHFILKNSNHIVVSSEAVKDDFYHFFKIPSHIKFHVYHFVSIIENLPKITRDELLDQYRLPQEYFIVSNQFHRHKNHKVVFEALAKIKQKDKSVHIIVTGRFPLDPSSVYLKELHDIINKNKLHENISLLGLIPRGDQLLLMKYAKAVIQPSLFEGWSTVIEDARSLQVPVIASDLNVNKEQLGDKGNFFSALDSEKLSDLMLNFPKRDYSKKIYEPYAERMRNASYQLLGIFKNAKENAVK